MHCQKHPVQNTLKIVFGEIDRYSKNTYSIRSHLFLTAVMSIKKYKPKLNRLHFITTNEPSSQVYKLSKMEKHYTKSLLI